jgi:hypothetical protein
MLHQQATVTKEKYPATGVLADAFFWVTPWHL